MEIDAISHNVFSSLISGADRGKIEDGCAWYATTNRQVVGHVYLTTNEAFAFTVFRLMRSGWKVDEPRQTFDRFNEAEVAMHTVMHHRARRSTISLYDVPLRLRFGRGRVESCNANSEPS